MISDLSVLPNDRTFLETDSVFDLSVLLNDRAFLETDSIFDLGVLLNDKGFPLTEPVFPRIVLLTSSISALNARPDDKVFPPFGTVFVQGGFSQIGASGFHPVRFTVRFRMNRALHGH